MTEADRAARLFRRIPRGITQGRLWPTAFAAVPLPPVPIGATIDLQGRLPPPQQTLLTPTIIVSITLIILAIIVFFYLAQRARIRAKREAYRDALKMAEKILLKRGGTPDDVDHVLNVFRAVPKLDPAAIIMMKTRFHDEFLPYLDRNFPKTYGEKIEKLFFPPPKDTRRALAAQAADVKSLVEEQKSVTAGQTAAALLDLMDATLKPGVICRLTFEGVEGGFECLVMGHDMNTINVTLPANNDQLVASIRPGMLIEGMLESGPSLLAFTSTVIQAVAGSMPYCRITPWKTAWEVRKRDAVRLPISLEIDFNHISTAAAGSIKMSTLDKELGTIRPGKLMDISLGGCAIETPSGATFVVGDMVRFSKSLTAGNPPATLLGAIVGIKEIDPEQNEGCVQRLHIQFLVIDDVSQRILVRTLRQLQDVMDRNEWMQAQQLMQKMRRAKIHNIGSPAATGYTAARGDTDRLAAGTGGTGVRPASGKPDTRSITKTGASRTDVRRSGTRPGTRAVSRPGTR
ncbi:MAG: PilZ domain-containing protein, partial [Planctomycetaceae bacterium]|nr:PilZ domain-containing protein [Planctomycetaceae bacterium]